MIIGFFPFLLNLKLFCAVRHFLIAEIIVFSRKNREINENFSARNSVCYSDWVRRIIRRIAKFVRSVSYSVKFDWPKKNRIRIRRTRGSDLSKMPVYGCEFGTFRAPGVYSDSDSPSWPYPNLIRIRIRRMAAGLFGFGILFGEWIYPNSGR